MFHVSFRTDMEPRGLIVMITSHVPPTVDMFFAISGFLVYRPFAVALSRGRPLRLTNYLRNRALRILPLYYSVTVVTFVAQRLTSGGRDASLADLVHSVTFTGIYVGSGVAHVLPVAWTLDNEIAFYLLLPLVFVGLSAVVGATRSLRAASLLTLGIMAVSMAIQLWLYHVDHGDLSNQSTTILATNLLAKFAPFGCGMLLANLHAGAPAAELSSRKALLVFSAGLGALLLALKFTHLYPPLVDLTFGLGSALVLGAIAFSQSSSRLIAILAWAPLAFLGEISFGVYLWHGPILKALAPFDILSHRYLIALVELYVLSAALASITYFLVEKPALRRKRRWATVGRTADTPTLRTV